MRINVKVAILVFVVLITIVQEPKILNAHYFSNRFSTDEIDYDSNQINECLGSMGPDDPCFAEDERGWLITNQVAYDDIWFKFFPNATGPPLILTQPSIDFQSEILVIFFDYGHDSCDTSTILSVRENSNNIYLYVALSEGSIFSGCLHTVEYRFNMLTFDRSDRESKDLRVQFSDPGVNLIRFPIVNIIIFLLLGLIFGISYLKTRKLTCKDI